MEAIVIFFMGLCLFTIGLSSQEIIGFESRFYLFAQEMLRHGPNWFPTTYQQPYADYPGTSTYFIYLFSHWLGGLTKLTAVLPSAIASAMTLSVTYLIGAEQNRRWGICAVFFLFMTLTFVVEARTISLDQYVTTITALCFYLVYRNKSLWLIAPLLVLAFAMRGPMGLIIPTGVMCVYYLIGKEFKRFLSVGFFALAILIVCGSTLLLLAYHVDGMTFLQDVLRMEAFGRIDEVSYRPFYFCFTRPIGEYVMSYPIMALMLLGLIPVFRKNLNTPELVFLKKLFAWMLVILIGLSIPADKKMRYLLPMAPALALICAYLFVVEKQNLYLNYLRRFFHWVFFLFPLIALTVIFYSYTKHLFPEINYSVLMSALILLQLLVLFFEKNEIVMLGLAATTFFVIVVFIVEPVNIYSNRTRDFVLSVEAHRSISHAPLVFYREGRDGLPIKYLINMSHEEIPVFLWDEKELLKLKQNTFVIMSDKNAVAISAKNLREVGRGKIGHDDVVVFCVDGI